MTATSPWQHLVVGLTGGIGSGKSCAAEQLRLLGAGLIDTDEISHALGQPGQPGAQAIARIFGDSYLLGNGAMDRARLRQLVFAEPEAKRRLESAMHPLIHEEVMRRLHIPSPVPYMVLAVPLLVESGSYLQIVHRVLVIDCPVELQIARVIARNGLSEAEVLSIMAQQASREARLRHADDVIVNDEGLDKLQVNAEQLHWKYLQLSESKNFSSKGL